MMRRLTREIVAGILDRAVPHVGVDAKLEIADAIMKELETERASGEPIFASVACKHDGTPLLNSIDELAVADLGWFENVPPALKALMGAMDSDEWCVIHGQFHGFSEYGTPQLIKRVL